MAAFESRRRTLGAPPLARPPLRGPRGERGPAGSNGHDGATGASGSVPVRVSPVYVEDYMVAASNDIKTAIKNAWAANPNAVEFVLPAGRWEWPTTTALLASDGLRPNLIMRGQNTTIFHDAHGVASGQIIFFFSFTAGEMHDQVWDGIHFEHLNALTGFASFTHDYEQPDRITIKNCSWKCVPDPSIIVGKGQWGAVLLGGNDNVIEDCRLDGCQVGMGGAGRSVKNARCSNIQAHSCNDLVISIVCDDVTNTCENVIIENIQCIDSRGNGVAFAGSDGGVNPVGLCRNVTIRGIQFAGTHADNIPRSPVAVTFDPGIVTENIQITDVMSQQTDPINANRGVLISSGHQTSWDGLVLANIDLQPMSVSPNTADLIFIAVETLRGLRMSNIRLKCSDNRGINITNVDDILASNVRVDGGTFVIDAEGRNLDSIVLSNVNVNNPTAFKPGLLFASTNGHNFSKVRINNSLLDGPLGGVQTSLNGGSMDMRIANTTLTAGGVTVETLAGITGANDVAGLF